MNPPARLLVRWRALSELKSHVDLIGWISKRLPSEVLVLSDSAIPGVERYPAVRVARIRESPTFHPAVRLLRDWKHHAEDFEPDMILALDEGYCFSTFQLIRWAERRNKPSLFLSCQNIDRSLLWPFAWMESRVLKKVTGGWFLNREALDRARARGFSGQGRIIPLPIHPEDYPFLSEDPSRTPVSPSEPPRFFTLGYAGRLVPEKGLETLIEACAQSGDRLRVVGEGPEGVRLRTLARTRGVEVEWLGSVPTEKMPESYSGMDILVLPSLETPRWKEQFGRVLVEAMASGVPVIGSRSGEIPRVIGEAGLLFEPGNADALAARIRTLKKDRGLYRSLRNRGLARVRDHFTLEKVGEKCLDLLRSCQAD